MGLLLMAGLAVAVMLHIGVILLSFSANNALPTSTKHSKAPKTNMIVHIASPDGNIKMSKVIPDLPALPSPTTTEKPYEPIVFEVLKGQPPITRVKYLQMQADLNRYRNETMHLKKFLTTSAPSTTSAQPPSAKLEPKESIGKSKKQNNQSKPFMIITEDHPWAYEGESANIIPRYKRSLPDTTKKSLEYEPVGTKPLGQPLLTSEDTDSNGVETRMLESGMVSPELGLIMEQSGSYMEFSGYTYVPIIYHMPHLSSLVVKPNGLSCNLTLSEKRQQMIVDILKDKVGSFVPKVSHRSKRFIESLFLGAGVAWNRASIWSLQNSVASLDEQLHAFRENNAIVTKSINTMMANQQAIYNAVDRQARILTELVKKSTCEELETSYFRDTYSTWLSLAPNDFSRVVDSTLSGKITPDLLPASDVLNVLMKHPSIQKTAYSQDLTLLYELGRFSLHKVSYDPYPMVAGVMVFPKIILDRSAALMKIQTTYFKKNDTYIKLDLPDVVACKNRTICWEISSTSCRDTLSLTLCQKRPHLATHPCITKLLTGNSNNAQCPWVISTKTEPDVLQFEGGLMLSAASNQGELFIFRGEELISKGIVQTSDTPQVLTPNDGDYLQYSGQLYQIKTSTMQVSYEIKTNITIPLPQKEFAGLDVDGWVPLDKVPSLLEKPWAPPTHYTWWLVISICCVSVIILIVISVHWGKFKNLKTRVKKELEGWTTVTHNPPPYNPQTIPLNIMSPDNMVV